MRTDNQLLRVRPLRQSGSDVIDGVVFQLNEIVGGQLFIARIAVSREQVAIWGEFAADVVGVIIDEALPQKLAESQADYFRK